jgi:hypothetical protein
MGRRTYRRRFVRRNTMTAAVLFVAGQLADLVITTGFVARYGQSGEAGAAMGWVVASAGIPGIVAAKVLLTAIVLLALWAYRRHPRWQLAGVGLAAVAAWLPALTLL